MIAYKGFTKDLTARMGRGFQFQPGETVMEENSKTVRSGFHCCENPFECLAYYPLGQDNRYFMVEASGSIDEDADERISCTEMTLVRELSVMELAGHGMMYMVKHPIRDKWQQCRSGITVAKDKAEGTEKKFIAIARGAAPRVKGVQGAILGLIVEPEKGNIVSAKLFIVGEEQAGKWYTLNGDRELLEVKDEAESD